ncbi:MAG: SagB/ThcOx family dehydrogenase [Methanomassiliicoccales archaeon]
MKEGIGDEFQRETRYQRNRMVGGGIDRSSRPPPYKEYPRAVRVELPPPPGVRADFDETVRSRRSIRRFSERPMEAEQLSYLLWASTGIQRREAGIEFRTAPSAGALYPIETYLVVNRVNGVKPGVYHYNIRGHYLEQIGRGDFSEEAAFAALNQRMCMDSAVVFIWTAVFQRSKWKYGQRGYRYMYLDAGHIGQNLALACTAQGLGSCQVAALFDQEVNDLVRVDGKEESVLYMSVAGFPR